MEWINLDLLSLYPAQCISKSVQETLNIAMLLSITAPFLVFLLPIATRLILRACTAHKQPLAAVLSQGAKQGVGFSLFCIFVLVVPASRRLFLAWNCKSFSLDDEQGSKRWFLAQVLQARHHAPHTTLRTLRHTIQRTLPTSCHTPHNTHLTPHTTHHITPHNTPQHHTTPTAHHPTDHHTSHLTPHTTTPPNH